MFTTGFAILEHNWLLFFSSSRVNKAAAQEGDTEILKLLEKESTVNRALGGNTDNSSIQAQSALC